MVMYTKHTLLSLHQTSNIDWYWKKNNSDDTVQVQKGKIC